MYTRARRWSCECHLLVLQHSHEPEILFRNSLDLPRLRLCCGGGALNKEHPEDCMCYDCRMHRLGNLLGFGEVEI